MGEDVFFNMLIKVLNHFDIKSHLEQALTVEQEYEQLQVQLYALSKVDFTINFVNSIQKELI
jgi:hypothetical protein